MLRTVLAACAAIALATGAAHAQPKAKYSAKIGHLEAPSQPRHQGLVKVAELVKSRTNGEVEFQLFPSSQLGNARQMIEGTQLGTSEGTVMPAAFLGGFNPAIAILDIPFLFPSDRAAAQKLRAGAFGKALLDSFSSRGFVAIALWPNGRKSLTSNKPLDSIEALKGQKFRVMDSRILMEQFAAVNASAVAIQFGELYTALQTGVMDGQENPFTQIYSAKLQEVQKYLSLSGHVYTPAYLTVGMTHWNTLPADVRKALEDTAKETQAFVYEAAAKDDTALLDKLKQAGMQVNDVDKEAFVAASKPIYEEFGKEVSGAKELIDRAVALRQ